MDAGHPPSSSSAPVPQGSSIACRQWYVPENKNTCPSSVHSLGVSDAAMLVKSGVPPTPSAITASGSPTSVSTMRRPNGGAPTSVPPPTSDWARNAQRTALPHQRKHSGGGVQPVDNGVPTAGVKENTVSMNSAFLSASRPSILLEEPRGAGHMHEPRLSPPSVDFKPPRGIDGQGMFTVHSCL